MTTDFGGWKIDANTITYLPLKWDLIDKTWNYQYSAGANFEFDYNQASIPVAHAKANNWYIFSSVNWPVLNWSNSYTVSWRVKHTTATTAMALFNSWYNAWNYQWLWFYKFYDGTYKWYFVMYIWWYSGNKWFEFQYNFNPWTSRHLWIVTYSPWSRKIYLDSVLVSSWSSTLSWTSTPAIPIEIWRIWWRDWNNPDAYYSDVLFQLWEKTQSQIQTYFNKMKSKYWY